LVTRRRTAGDLNWDGAAVGPAVIVHTGTGKGKSTAAFGLALRAWNQGWPVGVFQFVKSAKWRVGEETALRELGASAAGGSVAWHKMGDGWSWIQRDTDDHAERAAEGWAQIRRDLAAETYRLYVLDEFTYPVTWGWVDVEEVIAVLADRPGQQHVVITGRGAHPRLVETADLVTEMTKVKHPMDSWPEARRASVVTPPAAGHRRPGVGVARPRWPPV
jgi:cob(I)alamin adenosyltransferase